MFSCHLNTGIMVTHIHLYSCENDGHLRRFRITLNKGMKEYKSPLGLAPLVMSVGQGGDGVGIVWFETSSLLDAGDGFLVPSLIRTQLAEGNVGHHLF